MPVSPICLVAVNGGPFLPTLVGIDVGPNDTISIKLGDITSVTGWFLQVYGTDELSTNPTLTNVNPVTNQVVSAGATVTFSYPNAQGRAVLLLSTVTGTGGPLSTTLGIFSRTAPGRRVGAVGQTREGDPTFGWTAITNEVIRLGGGGGEDGGASLTPLGPNATWNVTHWWIDPVAGSDSNSGLTSLLPLKTWKRLVQIWGTISPVLTVGVGIEFLSDQSDASDPFIFDPILGQGGSVTVLGTLIQVATGVLGAITPKNRTTGTLLQADLAAAATGAKWLLLVNASRSSSTCWVDSVSGTVATLTQPVADNVPSLRGCPIEDDGFTAGDTFILYRPTKLYLAYFSAKDPSGRNDTIIDTNGAFLGNVWVPNSDPNPAQGASRATIGGAIRATQVRFDVYLDKSDLYIAEGDGGFVNCLSTSGSSLLETWINAGSFSSGTLYSTQLSGTFDSDVILHGTIGLHQSVYDVNVFGWVYTDAINLAISGDTTLSGDTNPSGIGGFSTGILYGPGLLDLSLGNAVIFYNPSAETAFSGGIRFKPAFANALDTSIEPGEWHPATALTAAKLDLPVNGGGFGGNAYLDTGARISNGLETSTAPTKLGPLGSNPSWSVANWWIDPSNASGTASDSNNGTTAITPLLTFRELVRRWQTISPLLTQVTKIQFLSDQPDTTDPIFVNPRCVDIGTLSLAGTLTAVATGVLNGVIPKNRAATGPYPAGLLQADLGAAAAGHQGYILVNTSKGNAVCWIDSISGTVATLTQPFEPNVPALADAPAEIDTFSNGDSFTVYKPSRILVSSIRCDTNIGLARLFVYHLWCFDPATPGITGISLTTAALYTECRIDGTCAYEGGSSLNNTAVNAWVAAGGFFTGCWIVGGAINSLFSMTPDASSVTILSGSVDGDAILRSQTTFVTAPFLIDNTINKVYLEGRIQILSRTAVTGSPTGYGPGVIYGSYVIDCVGASLLYTDSAALTFQGTPTLQMDENTVASAYDDTVEPGLWHPGRTLSPALLDQSVRDGGFGGIAYGIKGSVLGGPHPQTPPSLGVLQTVWYQDYVAGNDNNDGSIVHPVKTVAEIYSRWQGRVKGTRPFMPVSVTVNMVSAVPAGPDQFKDPVLQLADVDLAPGVTILIQPAAATVKRSGTLDTIVNPFSRTPTGQLTVHDAAVSDWSGDFDELFVDTTLQATSWVIATTGDPSQAMLNPIRATIDPTNPTLIVGNGLGPPVTVGATDQYQIITPLKVYFGSGSLTRQVPASVTNIASSIVYSRLWALDASGTPSGEWCQFYTDEAPSLQEGFNFIGATVVLSECRFDPQLSAYGNGIVVANCAVPQTTGILWAGNGTGEAGFATVVLCGYTRGRFEGYQATVDQDFTVYGIGSLSWVGQENTVGNCGRFGPANPAVHGIYRGTLTLAALSDLSCMLYGTGASGGNIFVTDGRVITPRGLSFGTFFAFDGNSFLLGGDQTQAWGWNQATGAFVGPTNCDVTLVSVTLGAGTGFGDMAIDPQSGGRAGVDRMP